MSIELRNIRKTFGDLVALDGVSLEVKAANWSRCWACRVRAKPPCCGSSRVSKVPDSGSVLFHGEEATQRSARDRGIGFVFQHYALFRHMTVFENVAFGLRVQARKVRPPEGEIRARVHELLELVQLDWTRVALSVAIVGRPAPAHRPGARAGGACRGVLLLDEPFGALDAKVRQQLRRWLRNLHGDEGALRDRPVRWFRYGDDVIRLERINSRRLWTSWPTSVRTGSPRGGREGLAPTGRARDPARGDLGRGPGWPDASCRPALRLRRRDGCSPERAATWASVARRRGRRAVGSGASPSVELGLAPLSGVVVEEGFRQLVASGCILTIPVGDESRFIDEALPRLQRRLRVTSSDGSVELPASGTGLLLTCEHGEQHTLRLSWSRGVVGGQWGEPLGAPGSGGWTLRPR